MSSDAWAYISRRYDDPDDQNDPWVSALESWVIEVYQGHHAISTWKIKFFFFSRS